MWFVSVGYDIVVWKLILRSGKIIGQLKEGYDVGEGAYVIGNDIISSVAGKLEVRKQFKDDTKTVEM